MQGHIKDVGPIREIDFQIPEEGGIVVFRGRNGTGKSLALKSMESLAGNRVRVPVRDRALKGVVELGDATMNIGRSTRRSGELEVRTLEGRLNLAELVDPGIASPDAADARRIKAIVQVLGVKPSAELFHGLLGKEAYEAVVRIDADESADLATMAARVKADFEEQARALEGQTEREDGHAQACREAVEGIDTSQPDDETVLQQANWSAVREEAAAAERGAAWLKTRHEAEAAAALLARTRAEALDVAAVQIEVNDAEGKVRCIHDEIEHLERMLVHANAKLTNAVAAVDAAKQKLGQANTQQALCEGWQKTIDAASTAEYPTEQYLTRLREAVKTTTEAVQTGVLVRKAKLSLAAAEKHEALRDSLAARAVKFREAAKGTDEVLSEVVSRCGIALRVDAGRLILNTPARGETYFAELSDGERWKVALDIGIEAVGEQGLLVIPQDAWEGLDPLNRVGIWQHVQGRKVAVLTAESDAGDLRGEIYQPEQTQPATAAVGNL